MKKLITLIAIIATLGIATTFAQNSVTLTFSCQTTDGGYLQPNSITIENLTRNWSETIYYPDTVYTLNVGTGVPNRPNDNEMQVLPNPFDGTTRVNIHSKKTETVRIILTDIGGRMCAEYNGWLQEGGNLLSVSSTTPQTYVLSVHTASGVRSLKMENVGRAGANRIAYEGGVDCARPFVQLKSNSSYPFQLGDEMSFTVYAYLYDTLMAHQTVTQTLNEDDNVIVTFPTITDTLNMSFCQASSFNPKETGFGNKISHVQDYDGNQYQVVQIGSQCWLKENIRTTHHSDGTAIPSGSTNSSTDPYRYAPYNDENNVPIYGYLYNWSALMNNGTDTDGNPSGIQGICPIGWHIPSSSEWTDQLQYFDAKAIADTFGWEQYSSVGSVGCDQSLNNTSGLSIRPAGFFMGSDYSIPGRVAYIWLTDFGLSGDASCVEVAYTSQHHSCTSKRRDNGNSVRCVRDDLRVKIVTDSVIITSDSSVVVKSNILSDHGIPVTSRGVYCSSTYAQYWNGTDDGNGTGYYYSTLDGIILGIPYWVNSYAYSDAGYATGNSISFAIPHPLDTQPCPDAPTVTDYDGNIYNTVQLGSQCWMRENLRTTHYSEGTSITLGDTPSSQTAYRYYPNHDSTLISTYGYLYNWIAVMNSTPSSNSIPSGVQGICPTGWHIPSVREFQLLKVYLTTQNNFSCGNDRTSTAKALADSTGWTNNALSCTPGNNQGFNNSTNFGIRPAGIFIGGNYGGSYLGFGDYARFWTASMYNSSRALYYSLSSITPFFPERASESYSYGFSVRCVKD